MCVLYFRFSIHFGLLTYMIYHRLLLLGPILFRTFVIRISYLIQYSCSVFSKGLRFDLCQSFRVYIHPIEFRFFHFRTLRSSNSVSRTFEGPYGMPFPLHSLNKSAVSIQAFQILSSSIFSIDFLFFYVPLLCIQ